LALAPFNPYARAYSPYGILDGTLQVETQAKFAAGRYDLTNALKLHQLDLSGADGDSPFEQQFGIPLTMGLALLRDASGDIDLSIPVQIDGSGGATVDVASVVRSALRQALIGAIESPLKLIGGVIGGGGEKGAVAPAPIAFALGRAAPTASGTENAERLAAFLAGRPGMAVELDAAVTREDLRWLHEQALRGSWEDEGFFSRAVAFVTERGPRERIGNHLEARAQGQTSELSAEDAGTLEQWLAEHPAPPPDKLRELAAMRIAAVDTILQEKAIDTARLVHGEPSGELVDGESIVKIKFRPHGAATAGTGSEGSAGAQPLAVRGSAAPARDTGPSCR
jgi:hypothetical protein